MNQSRHRLSSAKQLQNKPSATTCAATPTINFSTVPGSIQLYCDVPDARRIVHLAPDWSGNGDFNHPVYGGKTSVEPIAPPNFHGHVSTLAVHCPF